MSVRKITQHGEGGFDAGGSQHAGTQADSNDSAALPPEPTRRHGQPSAIRCHICGSVKAARYDAHHHGLAHPPRRRH